MGNGKAYYIQIVRFALSTLYDQNTCYICLEGNTMAQYHTKDVLDVLAISRQFGEIH